MVWEILTAAAGVELSQFVLEQVLSLGKAALEDYVKDFFKDCIKGSVAAAKAETLKKPMAEAIGQFIKRFLEELQMNEVEKSTIDHHYKKAIHKFVKDGAVRPVLGKAFETECKAIDIRALATIWQQQYQPAGCQFPEEFDWRGIGKKYLFEVKGIIKANGELRSLLSLDVQEQMAENLQTIAGINPGFNLEKYRESLQCSYGYLKLYTLDSTDRSDPMKLWRMFIEQTVREALPPLRYEIPLDVQRQLQADGDLDAVSEEALALYRQEYFQQPTQKVMEAIGRSPLAPNSGGAGVAEAERAVILGDPGAGKSTLLQYLALGWVEGESEALPLLIELREYALAGVSGFLEFFHRGKGADWQFDSAQLHQHLLAYRSIVMLDGLDEVFDRATQATIVDEIVRFGQVYPLAQVLVTSRIIGYNPERLQQAGFRQFTIQPLDTEEIHEFIDRWYDLALGNDADKERLVNRLKDAIANSKAIQNLADNPLLLTMMSILNRRQELPRDRADLYDQASRVLLYHWDVDHKRLSLPMDVIGRREKQEMLRLIAYEMQTREEGLKGNLITADRLVRILTDYLREQGFDSPREKANGIIEQLRHRNWILCDRGADTYGFVHRTFLEYFCAMEIVHRFEKSRSISFEQLRDEVFGQHWQDETWHEVLRLICGAIDPQFVGGLVKYLLQQTPNRDTSFKAGDWFDDKNRLEVQGLINLILAAECFSETTISISNICDKDMLLSTLKQEIENSETWFTWAACDAMIESIIQISPDSLTWLKEQAQYNKCGGFQQRAVWLIAKHYRENPEILVWLKEQVNQEENLDVQLSGVYAIGRYYAEHPDTISFLHQQINQQESWMCRFAASDTLSEFYSGHAETFLLLKERAKQDQEWLVRYSALLGIDHEFPNEPGVFELFCEVIETDPFVQGHLHDRRSPRSAALKALLKHYPTHPKTIELLHDRALNDPDEQLREWATEQLKKLEESD